MYAPKGQTGFSDGFPFLLASVAGLHELNRRLREPVTMMNFRPNIVVDGCDPFEEDKWKQVRVKNLIMNIVKPCSRCTMPNINPKTGKMMDDDTKPSRIMKSFRTGSGAFFHSEYILILILKDIYHLTICIT